ncbi:MAG: LamG-like jellyroll fold domain-containing protein [Candidatus Neomarinimicrobiota bacterium]|nr:LamG-like jellyroll fold domain-containing protein [Candidatus Neomarinimicrobiota bacterium]
MQKFLLFLIVFFSTSCSFFGGPDYDPATDSTALSFDGIDDYIQIDANVIPDSGDFSIAVWGNADSKQTGNRIVLSQNDTTGNPFYFGSAKESETTGFIRMGEDWAKVQNHGFPLDDNWHYFTIVNDGTVGDSADIIDTSAFFLDGKMIQSVMGQGKNYPTAEPFYIGTQWQGSGEYFSGMMDGLAIWDVKLTPEEITALFNYGDGLDPTTDTLDYQSSSHLIGFWPFNEGLDSTVTDYSGNDYNGTIYGATWERIDSKFEATADTVLVTDQDDSDIEEIIKQDKPKQILWGKIFSQEETPLSRARVTLYGYREGDQDEYYFETSVRTTRLGDFEFHDYQPWDTLAVSFAGYKTMVITLAELDINKLPFDFYLTKSKPNKSKSDDKTAAMARLALKNYEMIQSLIKNARPREVITIPGGVHIVSQPILVENKNNITIKGEMVTGIVQNDLNKPVLIINNSENIVFHDLRFGHTETPRGVCDAEVIVIDGSRKIYINGCEISGSGTIGVKGTNSDEIAVVSCFIHDNSWFAFSFRKCKNVRIENSRIMENKDLIFKRSSDVAMFSNTIQK